MMKEWADCSVDCEMDDVEIMEVAWKYLLKVEGMNQISNLVVERLCCPALLGFLERNRCIALKICLCDRK